jgi:hypothetical protein
MSAAVPADCLSSERRDKDFEWCCSGVVIGEPREVGESNGSELSARNGGIKLIVDLTQV